MIYRRWSLLTGPPAILAGVIGGLLVGNYLVFPEDPFKPKPRNPASDHSMAQAIGK